METVRVSAGRLGGKRVKKDKELATNRGRPPSAKGILCSKVDGRRVCGLH